MARKKKEFQNDLDQEKEGRRAKRVSRIKCRFCRIFREIPDDHRANGQAICPNLKKMVSGSDDTCFFFELGMENNFICDPCHHIITPAMCLNRQRKEMYSDCKGCPVGEELWAIHHAKIEFRIVDDETE